MSIREEVIVRAETNQKKALRAVLVRCEDLLFFHRAIGRIYGFVVFAFSFLFFARFLQLAFPASYTRELLRTYHGIPGKERRLGYIWAVLCFASIDIRFDVYCNDNLCFPGIVF